MATLNLVLDKRRSRKDGTYPLVFRIRIEKKYSDIATGFKLKSEEYDSKSSSIINDLMGNELLAELKAHYIKRLRAYMVKNIGREDIREARKYLVNKLPDEITIEAFWKDQIKELVTASRNGGARVYRMVLDVLVQEFNLNIPFSSFSYKDLIHLEKRLYERGMSANGINVYLRTLRAICNKAINYDLVGYEWYPFRKYTFRKEKTTPRVLSKNELKAYFSLDLPSNHTYYKSWLIGKLIFMLRGINIKDLLLLSSHNIKNNRVIYKRAKTGRIYSIELLDEVRDILGQFEANRTLLGFLNDKDMKDKERLVKIIMQKRKVVNAHIKKIGVLIDSNEPITTYVFRYSYSNLARRLGYSKDLIAEALGHQYGNSVTGIYLEQFDLQIVDEMNEKIVQHIMGGY